MARNDERRRALADAGLTVLATAGARGLTHRAVDREAGVPQGTTTNYFRNRAALLHGLVERIGERLAPSDEFIAERAGRPPSEKLFAEYLRNIVERLLANREVTIALIELRLEGIRRPEVAEIIGTWRRTGFAGDVAFNEQAGLPGSAREIALFHFAVDGLILDQLTGPLLPDERIDDIVDALVKGLLPA
ncbi:MULTISPECIES: TetR/AcrR family transcriptional regulator [Gordonia]|uniref:TetR/AcrR family transcriptional regulator n=1 Tax=Gordonia amicalis TaxID=89053 RepID=A0ABU4DH78_9ACTN|nr:MULTISPECIES: TetR/AcrR family transcriptional regulator [Gordonia]ATD68934.1 TetR family transcriptional regulator [Gordonia sp. 1D]MBA5846570.1 TetR family transcriptional regulator [Gordonia amicalis]MDV6309105.1 TetR/AcrR family transcriptional regulator [Gordonia amicalis]MDV7101020.1 TetR/AcrR family transcriptional regulator [Gordonia amicalis]MDV7173228.1 TetR/AcrR family transcriptional regulator [Gordonia amicalis]